jgi:hypothetical protein
MRISILAACMLIAVSLLFAEDELGSGESELSRRALYLDIESSSPDELRALSRRLGLPFDSDAASLRTQLLQTFGFEPVTEEKAAADTVTITSADSAVYRRGPDNILEIAELYGSVALEFLDSESELIHSLGADSVILNRYTGYLSAVGSVTYEQKSAESGEQLSYYSGSALTFSLASWSGSITEGETEGSRENSEGETVSYVLAGDTIDTTDEEILNVSGALLSTPGSAPHLSIRAGSLRVIRGGDWFATHALIRLGRVPIFYLPVFYYPGVKLAYNPSFGISTDRGYFINTTTALFGTLPEEEIERTSLSLFLSGEQEPEEQIPGITGSLFSIFGLFPDLLAWAKESESYLALTFDVYEKVGMAAGLQAAIASAPRLSSLSVSSAAVLDAVNRDPLYRFYLKSHADITLGSWIFSLSLPFYSDNTVLSDYGPRKTQFSLRDITDAAEFSDTYPSVSSFTWKLSGSYKPQLKTAAPYISRLELTSITSEIKFILKDSWEYEPESAVLLNQTGTMTGTLFTARTAFPSSADSPQTVQYTGYSGLYPPGLKPDAPADKSEQSNLSAAIPPDLYRSPSGTLRSYRIQPKKPASTLLSISASYTLKESGRTDAIYAEGAADYLRSQQKFDAGLTVDASFLDSALRFQSVLKPSGTLQLHSGWESTAADLEDLREQDREKTEITLFHDMVVSSKLFGAAYTLKTRVMRWNCSSEDDQPCLFASSFFIWGTDDILQHTLRFTVPLTQMRSELSLSAVLPPFSLQLDPQLSTNFSGLNLSISTRLVRDDAGTFGYEPLKMNVKLNPPLYPVSTSVTVNWDYETSFSGGYSGNLPLDISGILSFRFSDTLDFSQTAGYDVLAETWDDTETTLRWNKAYVRLKMQSVPPSENTSLHFEPMDISIFAPVSLPEYALWHNRIKLTANANANWSYSFLNPSDNLLKFGLTAELIIEEFLSLSVTARSRNSAADRYVNGSVSLIGDLLKSFNFFNIEDRYASNFNLDTIDLKLVHMMEQWNLNFDYTGSVALDSSTEVYRWDSSASVYIVWKGLPEIDLSGTIDHNDATGATDLRIFQGEE